MAAQAKAEKKPYDCYKRAPTKTGMPHGATGALRDHQNVVRGVPQVHPRH
ncbi:hypothetical protein MCOR25_007131 [Pyricularia grisea]|nr:hypothetical protein MCOR25_007131 [Pyricularia grisea]